MEQATTDVAEPLVDDTRQVKIWTLPDGRIDRFEITSMWRDHLSPQELADAIRLVPTIAELKALSAQLETLPEPSPWRTAWRSPTPRTACRSPRPSARLPRSRNRPTRCGARSTS